MAEMVARNKIRKERDELDAKIRDHVEGWYEARKGDDGEDLVSAVMSGEDLEKYERLVEARDQRSDMLRSFDDQKDRDRLIAERSDQMVDGTVNAVAKVEKEHWDTLLALGREDYKADRIPEKGHAAEYEMPAPLIAKGADGINRVHCTPAIFSDETGEVDFEASFRARELLEAGQAAHYDARTGLHRDNPDLYRAASTTVGSGADQFPIPKMTADLYRELVNENNILGYLRILQTPTIGTVDVPQRTAVPEAVAIGTRANRGANQAVTQKDATYAQVAMEAQKYGCFSEWAYETLLVGAPWNVQAQIAEDGIFGLRNTFGKLAIAGTIASGAGVQGLTAYIKATTGAQYNGVANANFLRGSNAYGFDEAIEYVVNGLPKEYLMVPDRILVMSLAHWAKHLVMTTGTGGDLVFGHRNTEGGGVPLRALNTRVVPDGNLEAGTGSDQIPMILMAGRAMTARLAGAMRVDYSSHVAFTNDALRYRFLQHFDCKVTDTKAVKGYEVS